MQELFRDLFSYQHHYNLELSKIFSFNLERCPEKSVSIFNHLLNAHQIWNNRIQNLFPAFKVWKIHPWSEIPDIIEQNHLQSMQIISAYDLEVSITYKTTTGELFSNSIRDILFHIINHTTYHRGYIVMLFRDRGIAPLENDYIFYKREFNNSL